MARATAAVETFRRSPALIRSRSMGRIKRSKPSDEAVLSVRVEASLIKELDEAAANHTPGVKLSRTQLVTMALRQWLNGKGREKPPTK